MVGDDTWEDRLRQVIHPVFARSGTTVVVVVVVAVVVVVVVVGGGLGRKGLVLLQLQYAKEGIE